VAVRAYAAGDPRFNLTGGPTGATPATLAALARPILHHLDPVFGAFYEEIVELLRQAFETTAAPVILHGEAVVGLEAVAASLIGPDDVVLNLVSGMFGRGSICSRDSDFSHTILCSSVTLTVRADRVRLR
jgi:aspartate aminotransferase-like enzyme